MLSRVLQKSLKWSSRAAFFNNRLCHDAIPRAFRRRGSNRSMVFALFLTNVFLVMFWSETTFYSRRTSTVVACNFATVRLTDHKGWQQLPLQ